MFFDMILLHSQHGGRFGIAWLAATRGLRFIKKKEIMDVNIVKLCEELELFIISHSTSPKKRFSLKLSTLLINGAVKIFRQQAVILQSEIFSLICTINVPVGLGSTPVLERSGVFETPPTPVPRIKTKRSGKKVVADTPEINLQLAEDTIIQLPNVSDILQPTARTEDIAIRDEICKRPEFQDDDFGFGVLTTKEEEMLLMCSKTPEAPTIHPQYPSSESLPTPVPIEVIAQVHVPRDGPVDEDQQLRTPVLEVEHPHIESTRLTSLVESTEKPLESTLIHDKRPTLPVVEGVQPITEIREVAPEERPVEHIPPIIEEIQPVVELREEAVKAKNARKRIQKPLVEVQLEKIESEAKKIQENEKLFLIRPRNTYVRINRCNENEGQFTDESCQLPYPFKNILSENLYELFWYEEDMENNAQIRGVSARSLSVGDSLGLRRTDTLSARMSAMDIPSTLEPGSRQSLLPLDSQIPESTPVIAGKHVAIEEPPVPLQTPRKRKRTTILEDKQPAISKLQTGIEQISVIEPLPRETISDFTVVPEQSTIPEELPTQEKETAIQEQPIPEAIAIEDKQRASPILTNYKQRQQKIVDIVAKWNSVDGILTIEDVCEKPINRRNIAIAFLDLLFLSAMKYVVLKNKEDSLELKSIEKGPKLLKR